MRTGRSETDHFKDGSPALFPRIGLAAAPAKQRLKQVLPRFLGCRLVSCVWWHKAHKLGVDVIAQLPA